MSYELMQGDCLERMKEIASGSVDMVLADPPYGQTQNKWDVVIPLKPMWRELRRVVKENGAILIFGRAPYTAHAIVSNLEMYRYSWIWHKTKAGGFLNANRMPLQAHEEVMVFYRKLPTYNPQMTAGKPYERLHVNDGTSDNYGQFERIGKRIHNSGERYPRSVITVSNSNYRSLHPTAKPTPLLEYFIRTYTQPDDVVLDMCMGSGTAGVAALNTSRKFIGIELDQSYFEIARAQIEEASGGGLIEKMA